MQLESGRAESLLAYLALHRDAPQLRQRVAFLLWPDSSEAQARTNLRHVLHNLRRALPEPDRFLDVTARTLQWRPDAPYWLDVAAFEEALVRADDAASDGAVALQEAVDSYTGDLLPGRDDEWVQAIRDRLRRRYLDALDRLITRLEAQGDLSGAVRYAERLLREEPLREETYRTLIRLHDARGDRARALRVYYGCAAALERELGVEPAAATRAAYEALLPRADERQPGGARLGGTPFVGRAVERSRLTAAWRDARKGSAHLVLLSGEPGIGKTRLAQEFAGWCAHHGGVTAAARAYPHEGALAYGPLIAWLRAPLVKPRVRRLGAAHLVELVRLLPELRSEHPGLPTPKRLPESDHRRRLYDAVAAALLTPAQPLVLLADDIQWWDSETLHLLHYLLRIEPESGLLVVATARSGDIGGSVAELLIALRAADRLTEIELDRLGHDDTVLLAERLRRTPLSTPEAEALYAQTEGNPLFVVEAMRAGWTIDGDPLTPKVQAVIETRLGQLSAAARSLVDVAAAIGREFTADVVSAASGADEDAVVRGLDELWRRRIIRELGAVGYDFSHDKIREVAYQSLSPALRRHLHRQVAQALELVYAEDLGPVSGQLARHYEEAGSVRQAVEWYARAANVAQQLYAHTDAVRLLVRALALLRSLPATTERSMRELELLTVLPAPLVASEGYASPRVAEMHQRAVELAQSLGADLAPPLLRSLALGALAHGDFAAAREFGLQLRARGERTGDDVLRVESEYVLGVTAFWGAELAQASTHLENAIALYRDENRAEHLLRYGQDPKVLCLTRLACTRWLLGDGEAALRDRDAGLAFADQIGHPYSRTVGLIFAGLLAVDMADVPALRQFVGRLEAARPHAMGAQTWSVAVALRAYLDVLDGQRPDGITRIRDVLSDPRLVEQAAPGVHSALLRILLAACDAAGDVETGVTAADQLLALPSSRVWDREAERLRMKFLAALAPANA